VILKHYTLRPTELESKHISQIHKIIEKVIRDKKDEYWKNYVDYSVFEQTAISISLLDENVKSFSSIYTRDFYGDGVYRIMNRWLLDDDVRETGGSKTYEGEHRFFDMIYQQIEYVKSLNSKFYFLSRQRKNTKWMRWYFDRFNKKYNTNLVVSDKQYMVCNGSEYDCSQTLIYPKDKIVPFKSYK